MFVVAAEPEPGGGDDEGEGGGGGGAGHDDGVPAAGGRRLKQPVRASHPGAAIHICCSIFIYKCLEFL